MSDGLFKFSWKAPGSHDAPEIEQTLADMEIRIEDHAITRIFDRRAGSYRDSIYVSLYPLAEWAVANWWFLFAEPDCPIRRTGGTSPIPRHSLRAAGDGFLFPDLRFWWEGETVQLSWDRCGSPHDSVEFVSHGRLAVPRHVLASDLARVVQSVVDRLAGRGIHDTWLQDSWTILQNSIADPDERAFCEASASLGVDPYTISDDSATLVQELFESVPARIASDLAESIEEGTLAQGINWLREGLRIVAPDQVSSIPLVDLRTAVQSREGEPDHGEMPAWEYGYRLADRCLQVVTDHPAHVHWEDRDSVDGLEPYWPAGVESIVRVHDEDMWCVSRKKHASSRRFTVARSLYFFVEPIVPVPRLSTSTRTWDQRASRAFAAQLLAPAWRLEERLGGVTAVSQEEIVEIANEFRVSEYIIRDQFKNHQLAVVYDDLTGN